MNRTTVADWKPDTSVELSGDDDEMKAKASIVRTDPFTFMVHKSLSQLPLNCAAL